MGSFIAMFPLTLTFTKLVDYVSRQQLFYVVCGFYGFLFFAVSIAMSIPDVGLDNNIPSKGRMLGWVIYISTETFASVTVCQIYLCMNASMYAGIHACAYTCVYVCLSDCPHAHVPTWHPLSNITFQRATFSGVHFFLGGPTCFHKESDHVYLAKRNRILLLFLVAPALFVLQGSPRWGGMKVDNFNGAYGSSINFSKFGVW